MITQRKSFLVYKTRTVADGEKLQLNYPGDTFFCQDITGSCNLGFDEDDEILPILKSRGYRLRNGEQFTALWLINDSGADATISFFIGTMEIIATT